MPVEPRGAKITVDIGDRDLYRAVRHAAVERDLSLREVVIEALEEWLERQEEMLDLAAVRAARDEPTVSWDEMKQQIREAEAGDSAA